jgi:ubiquinone/menaquinone biosynthesis C-methylase UbiE
MKSSDVGKIWDGNAASWAKQARAGLDVYRDLVNTPAFFAMLPQIKGLRGLDIGCGEGSNTRKLAERGADMVGIDISATFVALARDFESGLQIHYDVGDGTKLPYADASFDFTTAFMSLMDMPDHSDALSEAYRVTKPSGFFQFSILHPCFVPSRRKTIRGEDRQPTGVLIEDYFTETNGEIDEWHFSALPAAERASTSAFKVPRFHKTLATWVNNLVKAGWSIEAMDEPRASIDTAAANPIVADTRIAPLFLLVRARK